MGRSLVIVESPAKAKTINKYLGKDFVVKSSYGHIRDLPVSGAGEDPVESDKTTSKKDKAAAKAKAKAAAKKNSETARIERQWTALVRRMGIDPEHGWAAHYQVLPGKEKLLEELQGYAEKADKIYLATDLDREGEAIAWHLRESIGGDSRRYKRVVFSEITKAAIQEAFKEPGELNMDRVHAQQARRYLDRVVGFMLSPLLWEKVARGLSAGRVQSVATRLVVEREREIRKFIPDEYWELHADLDAGKAPLRAQIVKAGDQPFKPVTGAETSAAVAQLEKATYQVSAIDDRPSRSFPSAPYITSTLQQAASVRLGYSVKKTMMLAQRLYEAGHITYMRTDSTNLSAEAVGICRDLIGKDFGAKYLPEKAPTYASKEGAQEAHEAIRPTDVRNKADELGKIDPDEAKLYDLIWRQFVACQMTPAEYDTAVILIGAQGSKERYELRASGRVMRFDGWLKVMPPPKREETVLPKVAVGQTLKLVKLDPTQHFTKPPPRFTEASLVKELEKRGIGRPSTYASIISTIQDRGYVKLTNKRFYAEKLGDIVTDRLVENFTELLDYGFTAGLEEDLDEIATAKEEWKKVLDRFYKDFRGKISAAKGKMRGNQPVETKIECAKCGRPMAIRTGRTGVFLSCTGYSLPKDEKCTGTMNLVPGDEAVAVTDDSDEEGGGIAAEAEAVALRNKRRCKLCKTAMDSYLVDEKRKLHICGNNPDCPGVQIEEGTFKIKGYDGPVIPCDKCGASMQLRSGRFGKYFGCTAYPDCKNTRKLLRNGQPAPPKAPPIHMPELKCETTDAYFVLRDGAVGIFLAANNYPKSRETRSPQVADLVRHRTELDPKFLFLADAPAADPKGNPSIIRFSRKTREHYLISEKNDEPTGWMASFVDGKWVERKATEAEKKETTRKIKKKKAPVG